MIHLKCHHLHLQENQDRYLYQNLSSAAVVIGTLMVNAYRAE